MNVKEIIAQLILERSRIDRAIAALEALDDPGAATDTLTCPKCGSTAFTSQSGLRKHAKTCDGRDLLDRRRDWQRDYWDKNKDQGNAAKRAAYAAQAQAGPADNGSNGTSHQDGRVQCNQCTDRILPSQLGEHKRTAHPIGKEMQ